jgi:hypothetical protein
VGGAVGEAVRERSEDLDCLGHHELGALCVLLRHLLRLDRCRVLLAERERGDGNVVEHDVERHGALHQQLADLLGHHLTHGDQLRERQSEDVSVRY